MDPRRPCGFQTKVKSRTSQSPRKRSDAVPPRLFAKPILGWASIAMASAMLILFGFALFLILPLLTQPPSLAKEFLEKKEPGIDGPFVVALEYESFAIRTQGIQIALGFL